MEKEDELNIRIETISKKFLEETENKEIFLVSHFDTDGITSAAIMTRALQRVDRKFSLKIIKGLEREFFDDLPEDKIILFLDLASGSLNYIQEKPQKFYIIDHHELCQTIPSNVEMINPQLNGKEKISSSGLTYLFCKNIDKKNSDLAKLAILGMIGDRLDSEIDKLNNEIVNEGDIKRKRGLMIYPSTRPINRTLEYSSSPYIPGVTGNPQGVSELLRNAGIAPSERGYKTLLELTNEEMENLVTEITLRNPNSKTEEVIGDIYLIKLFSKLEDAREISAKINACSRMGDSHTAVQFCLEIPSAKKKVDSIHIKYKQEIVSALRYVENAKKIEGKGYVILNAGEKIRDTIIGTIASIISSSPTYSEGTIIITMSYNQSKIKVSARNVGRTGRNVREVLANAIDEIGGEVGGHMFAAGCLIEREKEEKFISLLKKHLEIELVRV